MKRVFMMATALALMSIQACIYPVQYVAVPVVTSPILYPVQPTYYGCSYYGYCGYYPMITARVIVPIHPVRVIRHR